MGKLAGKTLPVLEKASTDQLLLGNSSPLPGTSFPLSYMFSKSKGSHSNRACHFEVQFNKPLKHSLFSFHSAARTHTLLGARISELESSVWMVTL